MSPEEIRLECLKLAREIAVTGEDVVELAKRLAAFVLDRKGFLKSR
jgi:hypothetical protein